MGPLHTSSLPPTSDVWNKKRERACASSPVRPQGDKDQFPKGSSGLGSQAQAAPARQRTIERIRIAEPARKEPRPAALVEVRNAVAVAAGTWKVNVVVPEDFRFVRYGTDTFVDRATVAFVPLELGEADARFGVQHLPSVLNVQRQVVSLGNVVEVGDAAIGEIARSGLAIEHHFLHTQGERDVRALRDNDEGNASLALCYLPDSFEKGEECLDSGFVAGECDCLCRLRVKKFFESGGCGVRSDSRHGKPLLSWGWGWLNFELYCSKYLNTSRYPLSSTALPDASRADTLKKTPLSLEEKVGCAQIREARSVFFGVAAEALRGGGCVHPACFRSCKIRA